MNVIIDSVTKRVLRAGACYLEASLGETLVEGSFAFDPALADAVWVWDDQQSIFVEDFLAKAKLLRIDEVQAKSHENEGLGVPYNGYRFSIKASAKSNWLAVVFAKDLLSYPFAAPTGFGMIYNFQSANDVLGFFGAAMAYIQYWEESDEQLVVAINACTTVEQVAAIEDTREFPPS